MSWYVGKCARVSDLSSRLSINGLEKVSKDAFQKERARYLGLHSHLQMARRHRGYFKKIADKLKPSE